MSCIKTDRVFSAIDGHFTDSSQQIRLVLEIPGCPDRGISLVDARRLLLARSTEPACRDAVWSSLISRAQANGGAWELAAVWMMTPGLRKIAGILHRRNVAVEIKEIDSEILLGFIETLHAIDPNEERGGARLWWGAFRRGQDACARIRRELPVGDVELVAGNSPAVESSGTSLSEAVHDGVISVPEADLINRTRIEGERLGAIAERLGLRYHACCQRRARAESRLAGYLRTNGTRDERRIVRPAEKGAAA